MGFFDAIKGVFVKPFKGGKKEGFKGALKGTYKGISGLVFKPITGVLDLASASANGFIDLVRKEDTSLI